MLNIPSIRFQLFFAMLCFVDTTALCQSKDIPADLYKVSTIPDQLKVDANSVVRYAMENDVIKGPGKATYNTHTIVTILNEKDENLAGKVVMYNKKYSSVNSFEMIIYDVDGKVIKKYHKGDMCDRAAVDDETLVSDDRLMAIRHTIASYPITVETMVETTDNSLIGLGEWDIQRDQQSVQNSGFSITIAADMGFRYLNRNIDIKPQKSSVNGVDTYIWNVKDMQAVKLEDGALSWRVMPQIRFANSSFEFLGTRGDLSTWASFGKWVQGLNTDVCTLSPKRTEEIKAMTADLNTDKDKARFLYNYLQKNMRYISVNLGIGGLKPFAADFVDQKKYGDCKALSNYMYALLKAVGIPAHYALINAGANAEPATASFPYNYFNHAILCIPFKNDTTWLECTSTNNAFGKLGSFTENRRALLITDDGGKLVNTPVSATADNQFNSDVHLTLLPDGGAKAEMKIFVTGDYRGEYLDLLAEKTDDQKKYFIRELNLKQPYAFEIKSADDREGIKEVMLNMEYDKFCDIKAGDKLFYRPRLFDIWNATLPPLVKRKTDFYFDFPMQKNCVTTIDLPEGYEVETMPANTNLKFSYGNFDISYVYDTAKNQIVGTAKFNLNSHVIPAAKYNELQQYMDDIAKAQNKKLVIKRKA